MSGLVLGVGMMVDNSIVVLESCFRAIETEEDKGLLGYAKVPCPEPTLCSSPFWDPL